MTLQNTIFPIIDDFLNDTIFPTVKAVLQDFALSPGFISKLGIAFGENADLTELQAAWIARDFSTLPEIEIISAAEDGILSG